MCSKKTNKKKTTQISHATTVSEMTPGQDSTIIEERVFGNMKVKKLNIF